ncbi:MAG TPA: Gldg family protein [Dokdonella sp.]|nr:Gldg family protein [Dokdonella sp.]HQZ61861.1 Gldg family protein [Dokdonella sp.]
MNERLNNIVHVVLLIVSALLIGFLSTRYGFVHDISRSQRASLSEPSTKLLAAMPGPIEIVSYARPQGNLRKTIGDFIARYERTKSDLTLTFIDPDADPDAMRAAGVQIDGELELKYNGRSERLRTLSEAEISSALLRLSRNHERLVAFLEGEGERKPDGVANADLGQFGATLKQRGIHSVNLALATTVRVPDNVDLLVIANPRVAFAGAAAMAIVDYLERGGNLLWLLEADEDNGLDALAEALSIRVLPGVIVDGAGMAYGIQDPSFVAVNRYPAHAIDKDFDLGTLFPQPVALAQLAPPRWDFNSILQSSAQSWNETGHIPKAGEAAGDVRYDGTNGEISGPLDFGFAMTRLSPRPGTHEQRVVVIGDGDFISNSYIGNGGNKDFGTRVFDWLLADDALIEVTEPAAQDRAITLSDPALAAISFGFLLGLPFLLAGSGLWIWRRRRRR